MIQRIKNSIHLKALGSIILVELVMAGIFGVLLYASTRQQLASQEQNVLHSARDAYAMIIESESRKMAAALDTFMPADAPWQAYGARDRAKLAAAVTPLFERIKATHNISHFYFIEPDGRCFLRVHDQGNQGDIIARETFKRAQQTGRPASGIELGKTAFALRVVAPYTRGGSEPGSSFLEFGEEIEHFNRIVKNRIGSDLVVMLDKKLVDEAGYKKIAGTQYRWDALAKFAIASSTLEGEAKKLFEQATEEQLEGVTAPTILGITSHGGQWLALGAFPLLDVASKRIGVVFTASDVTPHVLKQRREGLVFGGVTLVILLLSALAASYILKHELLGPIVQLEKEADAISMGEEVEPLTTTRTDEIGRLVQSFERMRFSLKKSMAMLAKLKG